MKTLKIERFETSDQGTFGRIKFDDKIYFTLELPWRDNVNNISCIPSGIYRCDFTVSQRFHRKLYLVGKVAGRTGIRIHSANLAGNKDLGFKCQLNGCIAIGEKLGTIDGQKAVLLSVSAVRKLESFLEKKSFTLEIIDVYINP